MEYDKIECPLCGMRGLREIHSNKLECPSCQVSADKRAWALMERSKKFELQKLGILDRIAKMFHGIKDVNEGLDVAVKRVVSEWKASKCPLCAAGLPKISKTVIPLVDDKGEKTGEFITLPTSMADKLVQAAADAQDRFPLDELEKHAAEIQAGKRTGK